MNNQQALNNLFAAAQTARLTAQEHQVILDSAKVLSGAIERLKMEAIKPIVEKQLEVSENKTITSNNK